MNCRLTHSPPHGPPQILWIIFSSPFVETSFVEISTVPPIKMKNCKVTNVYGAVVVVIALLLNNYLCNQCLSPLMLWVQTQLRRGVLNTTLCDKNCQSLSPGTPVSSTNKTDRHNTTEILLKVALNTINPNPCVCCHVYMCVKGTVLPLSVIYLWYFGSVLTVWYFLLSFR